MRSQRIGQRQRGSSSESLGADREWRPSAPPPPAAQVHAAPSALAVQPGGHAFGRLPIYPAVPASGAAAARTTTAQRSPAGAGGAGPAADLGARIRAAAGGGAALPPDMQRQFSHGLGADLSAVRLHTDGEADRLARAVDAVAFTTGPDIFFRAGAYRPESAGGRRLLAHEAAHVAQQAAGPVAGTPAPGGVSISDPGDRFERAAEASALQVMRRAASPAASGRQTTPDQPAPMGAASVSAGGSAGALRVQRAVGFEFETDYYHSYSRGNRWSYQTAADVVNWGWDLAAWAARPINPWASPPPTDANVFKQPEQYADERVQLYRVLRWHGLQIATKKGLLHEDSANKFKIEPDGPYSLIDKKNRWLPDITDIEFVTEPFEESKEGIEQLSKTLGEIRRILTVLGRAAPKYELDGEFIDPSQHHFSEQDVYLAGVPGAGGLPRIKMQATQGVNLRDVPALFQYFGGNVPDEMPEEAAKRQHARYAMYGRQAEKSFASKEPPSKDQTDWLMNIMGRCPAQAELAVGKLVKAGVFSATEDLADLRGFLTLALFYIQSLRNLTWEGVKLRLTLMSRYSFDKLFAMLGDKQKTIEEHGGEFKKAIVDTLDETIGGYQLGDKLLYNIRAKQSEQSILTAHPQFWGLFDRVTLDVWLDGILAKEDRLSKSGLLSYLQSQGVNAQPWAKSIGVFLRGHANAERIKEAVGKSLAILENRGITGGGPAGELTMDQVDEVATAYLRFITAVKAAQGDSRAVGAFPALKSLED